MAKKNYIGIVSDIHNKIEKAEELIEAMEKTKEVEEIILLGDYFDNFGDNPTSARDTALWLKESLKHPKRIHLLGNHDLPYFYPWNHHLQCPGWTKEKQAEISKIISKDEINKFRPFMLLDGNDKTAPRSHTLISHAGITLASLYGVKNPKDVETNQRLGFLQDISIEENIKKLLEETSRWGKALETGDFHYLMTQGSRMGESCHGGPQWIDWTELEPIKGLNQIVGHTPIKNPQKKQSRDKDKQSNNYCLDTSLTHVYMLNCETLKLEAFPFHNKKIGEHNESLWTDVSPKEHKTAATWTPCNTNTSKTKENNIKKYQNDNLSPQID